MDAQYVFGPVPSRRLGISLGVDLVPFKTCTLDCVYCECGATTRLTTRRNTWVPLDRLFEQIERTLKRVSRIDFITFSGSGEPTLNRDIGRVIAWLKQRVNIPIAVLTNGCLLYRRDVRGDLLAADVVSPSLDAATPPVFRRVNRPHRSLRFDRILRGLLSFSRQYRGQLWIEVLIVKDLNDGDGELARIHDLLVRLAPDRVHLNSLDRPAVRREVQAVGVSALEEIARRWSDLPVEVVKRARSRREVTAFNEDFESDLINTVKRRPLTLDDLENITGRKPVELLKYIDLLEQDHRLTREIVDGRIYFRAVDAGGHDG